MFLRESTRVFTGYRMLTGLAWTKFREYLRKTGRYE
jgi:hypothetical protein